MPDPPRLMDRMRQALRSRHYSFKTEKVYVMWAERFIRFHKMRHPREMGAPEVNEFLTHLAVARKVEGGAADRS